MLVIRVLMIVAFLCAAARAQDYNVAVVRPRVSEVVGPFTFVASTSATSNSTNTLTTGSLTVLNGDLLIGAVQWEDTPGTITSFVGGPNTLIMDAGDDVHSVGNELNFYPHYRLSASDYTGAFTVTLPVTQPFVKMIVMQFRPAGGTTTRDISGTRKAFGNSSTLTTGTFSTTGNNNVICGLGGIYTGGNWLTQSVAGVNAQFAATPSGITGWCRVVSTPLTNQSAVANYENARFWAATVMSFKSSVSTGPPDTTPPAVPTSLVGSPGDSSVSLSWNHANTSDVSEYVVQYRCPSGSGSYIDATPHPTGLSKTVSGLTNGVSCDFRVSAIDAAANQSAFTTAIQITPIAAVINPNAGVETRYAQLLGTPHFVVGCSETLNGPNGAVLTNPPYGNPDSTISPNESECWGRNTAGPGNDWQMAGYQDPPSPPPGMTIVPVSGWGNVQYAAQQPPGKGDWWLGYKTSELDNDFGITGGTVCYRYYKQIATDYSAASYDCPPGSGNNGTTRNKLTQMTNVRQFGELGCNNTCDGVPCSCVDQYQIQEDQKQGCWAGVWTHPIMACWGTGPNIEPGNVCPYLQPNVTLTSAVARPIRIEQCFETTNLATFENFRVRAKVTRLDTYVTSTSDTPTADAGNGVLNDFIGADVDHTGQGLGWHGYFMFAVWDDVNNHEIGPACEIETGNPACAYAVRAANNTNHLYLNSNEFGASRHTTLDADIVFADDFEDQDWYNCAEGGGWGGELSTDGWHGTPSSAGPTCAQGPNVLNAARSGGAAGSLWAGDSGSNNGTSCANGCGGNSGDHALGPAGNTYTELWVRWYMKFSPNYNIQGNQKFVTLNNNGAGFGGITVGNLGAGAGDALAMCPVGDCNNQYLNPQNGSTSEYLTQNVSVYDADAHGGNWSIYEMHIKIETTPGVTQNGIYELWADDCGADGKSCPTTLTKRANYTNVRWFNPGQASPFIKNIWFENQRDLNPRPEPPVYTGTNLSIGDYILTDQIMVKKANGPIGPVRLPN